jgi:signal peptidase II
VPSIRRLSLVVACVVALDQVTKSMIVSSLSDGRVVHLLWTLQLSLGYNSGVAFSQGQGLGPVVGIVAIVAIVLLFRSMMRATSALAAWGLCLITAGAVGNVCDRVFRGRGWLHGRVVDFIDLQWFPAFNVADAAITIGAALLILAMFSEYRSSREIEAS